MTAAAQERLPSQEMRLGRYALRVNVRRGEWKKARVAERLRAKDSSLWPGSSEEEIIKRLGWLDLPDDGPMLVGQLVDFVNKVRKEGIKRVFLIGMGGSSLAPEVFEATFGDVDSPFVKVADSTHPDSVRRWIDEVDSDAYLFIVSSKSGSTLETRTLFLAFWHAMERWHSQAGLRFAAITDLGSPLEVAANRRGFTQVFSTPADVGGRFSALSAFGLVPAALSGADPERLLDSARDMLRAAAGEDSPAIALGAALGELALAGRDKLTFFASPGLSSFPNWIEQLVAESLGKDEKGIVPVVDELPGDPEAYGNDRVFVGIVLDGEEAEITKRLESLETAGHPVVSIRLSDRYDLGAEIVRWEVAVATAAIALRVQPFDQPDVESAKVFTRNALGSSGAELPDPGPVVDMGDTLELKTGLGVWLESIQPGDYIAIQAFLAPDEEMDRSLRSLQAALRDRTGCATSCGYGPRFLHSTGQLHKGGPVSGVFLQLVDRPGSDILVPEEEFSFATVISAQATGDGAALRQKGRRVLRLRLNGTPAAVLLRLRDLILG